MDRSGLEDGVKEFTFLYDFAKHGGAVGSITVGPKLIPPETIITQGIIRTITAVTSAGAATIAMHLNSSEDVLAAEGKASFSLDALIDVVPVGTAATSIICTAHTQLTVVVATAALTAGKFTVTLQGYSSQTT